MPFEPNIQSSRIIGLTISGNGVTASGTAGYIAQFTDYNILGNSGIYNIGSYVGLGNLNTSPNAIFSIAHREYPFIDPYINLTSVLGYFGQEVFNVVDYGASIGMQVNSPYGFWNLGVSQSSQETRLTVVGLVPDHSQAAMMVYNSLFDTPILAIANSRNIGINLYPNSNVSLHIQGLNTSPDYSLKIDDSLSTNLFSVLNNGNIGINESSPNSKLHITDGDIYIKSSNPESYGDKFIYIHSGANYGNDIEVHTGQYGCISVSDYGTYYDVVNSRANEAALTTYGTQITDYSSGDSITFGGGGYWGSRGYIFGNMSDFSIGQIGFSVFESISQFNSDGTTNAPSKFIGIPTSIDLSVNNFTYYATSNSTALKVKSFDSTLSNYALIVQNASASNIFLIRNDGKIIYTDGSQAAGYVLVSDANGVASWTSSTSGGSTLKTKSDSIPGASFSGITSLTYSVSFITPYISTDYSIQITGQDSRSFTYTNKTTNGFIIDTNSITPLTGDVDYITIAHGEN